MPDSQLPPLPLASWQPTRDALHIYSRLLGRIRQLLSRPQKHWQHVSLQAIPHGLATPPMRLPDTQSQTFELILAFGPYLGGHRVTITSTRGERYDLPIRGQSPRYVADAILGYLADMGVYPATEGKTYADVPSFDQSEFASTASLAYDPAAAERFGCALGRVNAALNRFRSELPGRPTPVQFWTHHFDLATTWFTGRRVPDIDPKDEERSAEQMTFGFSTGDEGTPDPYFYATAYPWPDGLERAALPAGTRWHADGWRGAELPYDALVQAGNPEEKLLEFLRAAQRAGAEYLRRRR